MMEHSKSHISHFRVVNLKIFSNHGERFTTNLSYYRGVNFKNFSNHGGTFKESSCFRVVNILGGYLSIFLGRGPLK